MWILSQFNPGVKVWRNRKVIKKISLIGGISVALLLNTLLWSQEIIDGIVAIVGDEIILRSDLLRTSQNLAMQMRLNPQTQVEEFEKLKKDVLQNLINEKVLLVKAVEDTIVVEDQQVEAALDERIQQLINQLGSKEKLEAYFGSPIKNIKKDYRDEIRKQLTVQAVQQEKLMNVKASRHEVESFYETMKDSLPDQKPMVNVRHILLELQAGETSKLTAMGRIREIQELIRRGEDFGELAKRYSEDPGSARNGGELGFVEKGTLFQSFEEVAFQLEPSVVSDVVETPVGFHLIQMIEKRGEKANMRHILIRIEVTSRDEGEVLDKLSDSRKRALSGEDFGELAKEFSQDLSTKEMGGDLGWLPLEELQIEAFKSAVDTLQVGEITHPFKTQFGYHIVKLEGRTEARKISLEGDWDQIQDWTLAMKRQNVLNEWIEEVKKDIFIKINEI